MGGIREHHEVLLFLAIFSRYDEAIAWGREQASAAWGPIALESEPFAFEETSFYERSMGADLKKMFIAFSSLIDPADLPKLKHQTNRWEQEFADRFEGPEQRPLNLDPGYVTEAKLVLASTKDRDHRIYLSQGIYAENTLFYNSKTWRSRPWTYPDYQRGDCHRFLEQCRRHYRQVKRT